MIRYVPVYGGKRQERLKIEMSFEYLSLTRQALDADCLWDDVSPPLNIPAKSSSEIADVTAALTTMWDEIRISEMAEREAKAKL